MYNRPVPNASRGKNIAFLLSAAGICFPWLLARLGGAAFPQPWAVFIPGLCILGSAFLLTWAAEAAEVDIPQGIAIALLALIAVLPEYAVDVYFAWMAGKQPEYTAYATANMTGANRLLIGVGWPSVLAASWWKYGKRAIHISQANAVELVTLLAATLYAFAIPLKSTLSLVDTAIFFLFFCLYAYRSAQSHGEPPELEGPAELIGRMPTAQRRAAIIAMFLFAAVAICLSAEPFAEGILDAGRHWGIEEFILVQWLAPLASEAPEFIVALLFALKGKAATALRALVSSKVNQWTLLVGMLPLAFSLSSQSLAPMALDARQTEEIFLTAAQSLFALAALMNLEFTIKEAVALFGLFTIQLVFQSPQARFLFAGFYLAGTALLLATQRQRLSRLRELVLYAVKRQNEL